jgi:hypothetical protein
MEYTETQKTEYQINSQLLRQHGEVKHRLVATMEKVKDKHS